MKKVYLFICFLLTSVLVVQAQKTWTGAAGDTLWHTAGNWNPTGVPTASDSVIINNTSLQIIYFSADASAKNINLRGSANVMFVLKGVAASTVRTINLGGTISSDYNTTALQFSGSLGSLTLNTNRTSGANSGIKLNILTGNKATITKTIHLSGFWGSTALTATQDSISSSQSNGIVGVDASSVIIGNGGAIVLNQRNNGTGGVTPFSGSATNGIVFQSGSIFSNYTASAAVNPFTTSSGTGTAQFLAGSQYNASLSTAAPVTSFNANFIMGRTFGSFFTGTMTQPTNTVYTNTTTTTTTFLDSFVVNSNGTFLITLVGDATNVASPTYSFGGIRVSSTAATPSTTVTFRSSNTGGATASTSVNISGNITILSTASNTSAGTIALAFGPNATSQATDLNINFTGTTNLTISKGASATLVNPGITIPVPTASVGSTVFNINNGATLNLGDSISLRTTLSVTKFNIKPTGRLTLIDDATLTTNNNGYAILESDTTGSATIGSTVGKLLNGFVVRRFIGRNAAWRTLGFPFNTVTYSGTNPVGSSTVDLNTFTTPTRTSAWAYYYDETADDGKYGTTGGVNAGWKPITTSTTGLAMKNGLLLYGSRNLGSAITISDTGFINYGTQTIPLTKTVNGWNLVANPYPSNISWSSILGNTENDSTNNTILANKTVYRVRPLGGGAYSWASYNTTTNTASNGGSDVIENGAAFFVQAAGNVNLTIKEANKTTASPGTRLMGIYNANSINLSLTGANTFTDDVTFVWGRFSDATEGFDANLDAYDLGASGTHDLSIVGNDDTRYAVFTGADLSKDVQNRTYKLAIRNLKLGTYTFTTSMPRDLDRNNEAYLVDKFLNKATLVKEGMQVSFDVTADAASKAEDRFQLEVRKKLTSVADQIASSKTYLLSNPTSNNQFAIHFGSDAQVANWQVVDLSGRVVSTGMFKNVYQGDTRVGELNTLQSGTYMVRLFNDNEPMVVMKLVKL